jgi:hypothetical protein
MFGRGTGARRTPSEALNLRQGDLRATPEAPLCEQCGQPMVFKWYPEKTVQGLEADTKIPRAYYVCLSCKEGLFPPGPPT